jgi:hypothetical protein
MDAMSTGIIRHWRRDPLSLRPLVGKLIRGKALWLNLQPFVATLFTKPVAVELKV